MESTFVECKGCKKHWYNGIGLEMCDNDWNCSEHEYRHRTKDVCTITWHPYPQEKPIENERYLLTCEYPNCIGVTYGKWWDDEFCDIDEEGKVIAWAEMPNPYEG